MSKRNDKNLFKIGVYIKYNFKIVFDAPNHPYLKNLLTMFVLCQSLIRWIFYHYLHWEKV